MCRCNQMMVQLNILDRKKILLPKGIMRSRDQENVFAENNWAKHYKTHKLDKVYDVFGSECFPVWEHQWKWGDCFPQQSLMMPDGLFSHWVPALKADHYRALCSFCARAVAQKMSCHQLEEGMQRAGHCSDLFHSGCHHFRKLGRSVMGKWNTGLQGF